MNSHSYAHLIFDKGAKNMMDKSASSTNVAGKTGYLHAENKLYPCLSPCTSIISKWIKDLNTRPEPLKLEQERAGNTLESIGTDNDFLNRTPVAQQLRERIDKWDYMKFKTFCTTTEMVTKLKMLCTEWEKIFANSTSDKGLITRIYRDLKKNLNSPKINNPVKKWTNELNRGFSKEEVQMAKNHMKNCSPSLAIKEMQIKTTSLLSE
jgi:hypothetical protein